MRYQHTSSLRNELLSTLNLRMICGFIRRQDVPSESTFSRAFTECAKADLGTLVHDALVKEHMSTELIGHVSRDSTAIIGREKPAKKIKEPKVAKKRGRPAKGEKGPPKRIEAQRRQSVSEASTLEQISMCVDLNERKSASFPVEVLSKIKILSQHQSHLERPDNIGRKIGIRKQTIIFRCSTTKKGRRWAALLNFYVTCF